MYDRSAFMSNNWNTTTLNSEAEVFHVLTELRGKQWMCRGQPKHYGGLMPLIDRKPRQNLSRCEKLKLERQSIDIFRSTVRFFSDSGEQQALVQDITALMVLRNYGVPTRLLDWSLSPYVAAYFAVCELTDENGEIWSFDRSLYERKGGEQWKRWPETTINGDGQSFSAELTAFTIDEPRDWVVCVFYPSGFPRQNAQAGAYTLTARFGRDHAESIANLLDESCHYHRYVINSTLKTEILRLLREKHGIWRGSLFPDSAGAADTAHRAVFPEDLI